MHNVNIISNSYTGWFQSAPSSCRWAHDFLNGHRSRYQPRETLFNFSVFIGNRCIHWYCRWQWLILESFGHDERVLKLDNLLIYSIIIPFSSFTYFSIPPTGLTCWRSLVGWKSSQCANPAIKTLKKKKKDLKSQWRYRTPCRRRRMYRVFIILSGDIRYWSKLMTVIYCQHLRLLT